MNLWKTEPAAVSAVVAALVAALALPDAWAKVVMAVVSLAAGAVTRSQVYSPATVAALKIHVPPPAPEG